MERNGQYGARLVNTNYINFAPRIGIAYSPNSNWVVRAGFGIFYDQESKNSIFDTNRNQAGRFTSNQNTHLAPTFTYTNFINTAALPFVIDPSGLVVGRRSAIAHHLHDAVAS